MNATEGRTKKHGSGQQDVTRLVIRAKVRGVTSTKMTNVTQEDKTREVVGMDDGTSTTTEGDCCQAGQKQAGH